jgi:hypothetical protein
MLHDNEKDNHEDKTLETDSYLQDLIEIFHQLVSLLEDLKHPREPRHSHELVEFPYAGKSRKPVKLAILKN